MASKNEIKEDHSKRGKIDNLHLHRKRSFIDQLNENSPLTNSRIY